jgi:hypothetical protein
LALQKGSEVRSVRSFENDVSSITNAVPTDQKNGLFPLFFPLFSSFSPFFSPSGQALASFLAVAWLRAAGALKKTPIRPADVARLGQPTQARKLFRRFILDVSEATIGDEFIVL